jgi:hypothetical protein
VTNKPAPRVSPVLLLVLLVALAIGAAASILATASTAPPPSSGTASLVILPEWVIAAVSWGIVALVVGSLIVWRLSAGPSSMMTRMAVTILAVVLLGIVFLIAVRFAGFGGVVGTGGSTLPHSGNTTYSSNNTTVIKGNLTSTGNGVLLFPSLPGWVPFLILGLVVLLVVAVGIPQTRRYIADRRESGAVRRRSSVTVSAGMREALTRASSELDLGGDPRVVILALYASMLQHLQPMVDDIGTSTPEEIRAAHLVRLGVRPEAARTLTRLFEEARYSEHPMGPAESSRTLEAVRATLDDLARRTSHE